MTVAAPFSNIMNTSSHEWIDRFCRHLVLERRMSPHTHSNYRRDLQALVAFCDRVGVADWTALDVKQVQAFAARSRVRGLGSASIQRRLSAVRTFMAFLMRENVLTYNAAKDVTGQIFGVRMNEIFLFGQQRPIRSVQRGEGWTPQTIAEHAIPALKPSFYKLDRSADVFSWDPI